MPKGSPMSRLPLKTGNSLKHKRLQQRYSNSFTASSCVFCQSGKSNIFSTFFYLCNISLFRSNSFRKLFLRQARRATGLMQCNNQIHTGLLFFNIGGIGRVRKIGITLFFGRIVSGSNSVNIGNQFRVSVMFFHFIIPSFFKSFIMRSACFRSAIGICSLFFSYA